MRILWRSVADRWSRCECNQFVSILTPCSSQLSATITRLFTTSWKILHFISPRCHKVRSQLCRTTHCNGVAYFRDKLPEMAKTRRQKRAKQNWTPKTRSLSPVELDSIAVSHRLLFSWFVFKVDENRHNHRQHHRVRAGVGAREKQKHPNYITQNS